MNFPFSDKNGFKVIHERWMKKRNREQENVTYKDQWYSEQCFMCTYFIHLSGDMGSDYGVCSNLQSEYDAQVRFEHDGCDSFTSTKPQNQ